MSISRVGAPASEGMAITAEEARIFDERESVIRSYSRAFPALFSTAKGAELHGADGQRYLDFLAGAGALNYGHNHPRLKAALLAYIEADGLTHGLDLHTSAKARFLRTFSERILAPRGLDHRVQFTGPTGTNAVEVALKIARKATGRHGIFAFMGGYHGHSLGSLAVTANRDHRQGAGTPLGGATFLPYHGGPLADVDSLAFLRALLEDSHSGVELPAAVILETVQAEGGVNIASVEWLRELREVCTEYGIVLIVDEIQTGCGRTGPFFSFEHAGIVPDVITLSKSISGYGLPMALTLLRPHLDLWTPGEHTGTFRGNQLAFVTGAEAIDLFLDEDLEGEVARKGAIVEAELGAIAARHGFEARGVGLIWGLDTCAIDRSGDLSGAIGRRCFADGLIIERVGRNDTVLKLLPPLTISDDELRRGLQTIGVAADACVG
jgi:diaminobutyrate-2-oxoglutarate transaminase